MVPAAEGGAEWDELVCPWFEDVPEPPGHVVGLLMEDASLRALDRLRIILDGVVVVDRSSEPQPGDTVAVNPAHTSLGGGAFVRPPDLHVLLDEQRTPSAEDTLALALFGVDGLGGASHEVVIEHDDGPEPIALVVHGDVTTLAVGPDGTILVRGRVLDPAERCAEDDPTVSQLEPDATTETTAAWTDGPGAPHGAGVPPPAVPATPPPTAGDPTASRPTSTVPPAPDADPGPPAPTTRAPTRRT